MEYANPNVLVDTKWVEEHLNDDKVRIAEVDYDPKTNIFLATYQILYYSIGRMISMIRIQEILFQRKIA